MSNKVIAYSMFSFIGLAFATGILESSLSSISANILFFIAGWGMVIFGIWAGTRLLKDRD